MINHARTLLLNSKSATSNVFSAGDEFVPPDFVETRLPPWLVNYRRILFGADPDRLYVNYQVDRLLRVVHATEYAAYLTLFDERLTYDPLRPGALIELPFGLEWGAAQNVVKAVSPLGNLVADEVRGRMQESWTIALVNATATVTHDRTQHVWSEFVWDASRPQLSVPLTLPGVDFRVTLGTSTAVAADWDDVINLKATMRPQRDLSEIEARLRDLREYETYLFDIANVEPYTTFRNLWNEGSSLPERLSGFVLAMIYRMHALNSGDLRG